MQPQCPLLYTDSDEASADCYPKHRSYGMSAVRHSLPRVEAHLSRGLLTTSYIVYDEYTVTSDYSTNGSCIIQKGAPIALPTLLSYTVTAGKDQSEAQYFGLSSFQNFLGFQSCAGVTVTPVPLALTQDSPSISFSSPYPSTSASVASTVANMTSSAATDRVKGLSRGQKVGIGTATPVGATALLVLALFLWRKINKKRENGVLRQRVQIRT